MDWKYEGEQLLYQDNLVKVILKGKIEHCDFSEEYGLNPYFLFEWKKYTVKVEAKEDELSGNVEVFFGDNKASLSEYGFWEFTFRNYIGKSEIRIYVGNRLLPPLNVEVTSEKLSLDKENPLFYPKFWRKLVEDLEHHMLTLPFEISSPTYIAVEDIPVPPNLLILYHQILAAYEKILEGIQTILMHPHKDLTLSEEYVNFNEVAAVNPDVCVSIMSNPHLLVKSDSSNISLSSKLKGYLPRKIVQFRNVETFNTPENRFVKQFLKELSNYITQIEQAYQEKLREKTKILRNLRENIEIALQSECFQLADESIIPSTFTSQVLLKKDGYREILQARNQLLLSKSPVFTYLQEKISQRNIAKLYELWCFFELSKKLAEYFKLKDKLKVSVETTFESELVHSKIKSKIGNYELVYNRKFARSEKGSYSVPLKPDFSLLENNSNLIVFDAKFRFSIDEQVLEEGSVEDPMEEAIQQMQTERIANISDILKMHTYKDALNVKSAVLLYPGNKNVFYKKYGAQKIDGTFEEIFEKICQFEEGVGYLSFSPE